MVEKLILMTQNDIYLDRLNMVFQLSSFLHELKIKYYRKLFPDKSKYEISWIIYKELVDYEENELKKVTQKHTNS